MDLLHGGSLQQPSAVPANAAGNRVINVDMSGVMPKGGAPKPGADGQTWGAVDTHGEFFKPVRPFPGVGCSS